MLTWDCGVHEQRPAVSGTSARPVRRRGRRGRRGRPEGDNPGHAYCIVHWKKWRRKAAIFLCNIHWIYIHFFDITVSQIKITSNMDGSKGWEKQWAAVRTQVCETRDPPQTAVPRVTNLARKGNSPAKNNQSDNLKLIQQMAGRLKAHYMVMDIGERISSEKTACEHTNDIRQGLPPKYFRLAGRALPEWTPVASNKYQFCSRRFLPWRSSWKIASWQECATLPAR